MTSHPSSAATSTYVEVVPIDRQVHVPDARRREHPPVVQVAKDGRNLAPMPRPTRRPFAAYHSGDVRSVIIDESGVHLTIETDRGLEVTIDFSPIADPIRAEEAATLRVGTSIVASAIDWHDREGMLRLRDGRYLARTSGAAR